LDLADISYVDGKICVKTPYNPRYLKELKDFIARPERTFDRSRNAWMIADTPENRKIVEKLVSKYFRNLEQVLIVAICDGEPLRINGMEAVRFSRDYHEKVRNELVHTVEAIRVGRTGSRRYPSWNGYILAKAYTNSETGIKAFAYRIFPFSAEVMDELVEFIRHLAKEKDDRLSEAAEELEKFTPGAAIKEKETNVEGIFDSLDEVISSLEQILMSSNGKNRSQNAEKVIKLAEKLQKSIEIRLKSVNSLLELARAARARSGGE